MNQARLIPRQEVRGVEARAPGNSIRSCAIDPLTGICPLFVANPSVPRSHFINRAVLFEIAMLIFLHDKTRRTDRRTMGDSGAFDPEDIASCRWPRQARYAQRPCGAQWHPVGAAHRCGVGRSARALSLGLNLLSPIQPLGTPRSASRDTGGAGARLGKSGQDQSFGMFYRRHLRSGEKGGCCVGKTKRGKGTKLMVIADAAGLPLAVHTTSASPHEVTLVEATLDQTLTVGQPRRLIGDLAYDSDPLDRRLATQGIELIAPHKRNRIKPATQDGRALRRYCRRWKIERLFAWLNKYKRVITRWDRLIDHFNAFVHLACSMILMRRYL
jgi:transposase